MSLLVNSASQTQSTPNSDKKVGANKEKEQQKQIEMKNNYKEIPDTELMIIGELVDSKIAEYSATLDALKELNTNPKDIKTYQEKLKSLQAERQHIIQEFKSRNSESEKPKLDTKG